MVGSPSCFWETMNVMELLLRGKHCPCPFLHLHQRRRFNRLLRWVVACLVGAMIILCVVVPLVFHFSPALQGFFLFMNTVGARGVNFHSPEDVGLPGTRNFYLETDEEISVGLWHILPWSLVQSVPEVPAEWGRWYEESLARELPIILYLHGNKGSRAEAHRVELYSKLRAMDYHVIALDYRGYGDSSSVTPSEEGLVRDTQVIFKYLQDKAGRSPVFVWGHSLGTGVSCHALSELCQESQCPQGLVLEAAFNNLHDEIRLNPLSQVFHSLPYFDWAFVDPLKQVGNEFKSDVHIAHISCPILLLHAQDDFVVPVELARKLHKAARDGRPSSAQPITYVEYESKYGLNHINIPKAPSFQFIVRTFIENSRRMGK